MMLWIESSGQPLVLCSCAFCDDSRVNGRTAAGGGAARRGRGRGGGALSGGEACHGEEKSDVLHVV